MPAAVLAPEHRRLARAVAQPTTPQAAVTVSGDNLRTFASSSSTWPTNSIWNHSHYFDTNTESLHNIATIATGHGAEIGHNGDQVPYRPEPGADQGHDARRTTRTERPATSRT